MIDTVGPDLIAVGDLVTVEGSGFGDSGRIAVERLSIPESSIRRWTSQLILFSAPETMQSGLMQVHTSTGSSNPVFVTMQRDLPENGAPRVSQVTGTDPDAAAVGEQIRISGSGFGPRAIAVGIELIPVAGDGGIDQSRSTVAITASATEVVSWRDDRIAFVLPPGAEAGTYRLSLNGTPTDSVITIDPPVAEVIYGEPQRYAVRSAAVAAEVAQPLVVTLPAVPQFAEQPEVQLVREGGVAEYSRFGRAGLYQLSPRQTDTDADRPEDTPDGDDGTTSSIQRVERVSLTTRRSVVWTLTGDHPSAVLLEPWFREAYRPYLGAANGIPVEDPIVTELLRGVDLALPVAELTRRIHRIVIDALDPSIEGRRDPVAVIAASAEAGSSEDPPPGGSVEEAEPSVVTASSAAYATLFVALARRAGIPARRHFGVVLDDGGQTVLHAWVECFVPGAGWIPADPAIGDGILDRRAASVVAFYGDDPANGSWGALDDRRVSLSIDGAIEPPVFPFGEMRTPEESWAPGTLRVEVPTAAFVQEPDVRWEMPSLFASLE